MPVKVARLSAQSWIGKHDGASCVFRPFSRPPEIEARNNEKQEREIAGTGDSAPDGAALLGRSEPAMNVRNGAEKPARLL